MQRTFGHPDWPTLSNVADIYVGEIFDNAPNRKFLSDDPVGPIVLRGANLDRYLLREEATQGAPRYLREKAFNSGKAKAGKFELRQFDRIGIQRGSAVDNWRRLIGAIVPAGHYCFDTVLLVRARCIPLRVLLGIINSDLWEWRFRCTSMTNHVNEYDLADLAIPPTLTDLKHRPAAILDDHVKSLFRANSSSVRRSECQDVKKDSIDRLIDAFVFEAYGVSQADQRTICESLSRQTAVRVRLVEHSE